MMSSKLIDVGERDIWWLQYEKKQDDKTNRKFLLTSV